MKTPMLRTAEKAVMSFPANENGANGNWCWRRNDEHHSRLVLSMCINVQLKAVAAHSMSDDDGAGRTRSESRCQLVGKNP
jgi:hypothetical protein